MDIYLGSIQAFLTKNFLFSFVPAYIQETAWEMINVILNLRTFK